MSNTHHDKSIVVEDHMVLGVQPNWRPCSNATYCKVWQVDLSFGVCESKQNKVGLVLCWPYFHLKNPSWFDLNIISKHAIWSLWLHSTLPKMIFSWQKSKFCLLNFLFKKPHFWFIGHSRLNKYFSGKPSNTLVSQLSTLIGAKEWVKTTIDNKKNIQSVLWCSYEINHV
jgi:hypothetical protein